MRVIVFAMPQSETATARRLVGGHAIGLFCGTVAALLPHAAPCATPALYAAAVGASIFLMVVLDCEHPPAAGTALGIAITGCNLELAMTVLASVAVLSAFHSLLGRHLRNLV
jgi:CBS-domain-containing membrane protein